MHMFLPPSRLMCGKVRTTTISSVCAGHIRSGKGKMKGKSKGENKKPGGKNGYSVYYTISPKVQHTVLQHRETTTTKPYFSECHLSTSSTVLNCPTYKNIFRMCVCAFVSVCVCVCFCIRDSKFQAVFIFCDKKLAVAHITVMIAMINNLA